MPRVPEVPAAETGLVNRLVYWFSRRRYGVVAQPVAVLAHHRKLLTAMLVGELVLSRAATVLPAAVRELAVYRAAVRIGCPWCVDYGTMLMRNQGLDIDRLKEIDEYRTSPHFTEVDRLVIEYTDAMTDQPMRVTDEQVAQLDRRLGHAGLVELTYLIATENQRSRTNHALGLTAQGFTSGDACRVSTRTDV